MIQVDIGMWALGRRWSLWCWSLSPLHDHAWQNDLCELVFLANMAWRHLRRAVWSKVLQQSLNPKKKKKKNHFIFKHEVVGRLEDFRWSLGGWSFVFERWTVLTDVFKYYLFIYLHFCIPQLYLWGSPFWGRFLRMCPFFVFVFVFLLLLLLFFWLLLLFFNLTIEVVTFRLRGWCMLGVLLLPVFTRLGHECQDLLNPCDGMHMCTD